MDAVGSKVRVKRMTKKWSSAKVLPVNSQLDFVQHESSVRGIVVKYRKHELFLGTELGDDYRNGEEEASPQGLRPVSPFKN